MASYQRFDLYDFDAVWVPSRAFAAALPKLVAVAEVANEATKVNLELEFDSNEEWADAADDAIDKVTYAIRELEEV